MEEEEELLVGLAAPKSLLPSLNVDLLGRLRYLVKVCC